MRISCCKDCVPPERTPYCHSTCQKYIEQKAALDAHNEERRKQECRTEGAKSIIISGCLKVKKWRRSHR